jgi:hypothetical protein
MGKRTKEHKRKVAKRNARIQNENNLMKKLYNQAMELKMEEFKEKMAEMNLTEEELESAVTETINEEVQGNTKETAE